MSHSDLVALDEYLTSRSYLVGYSPSSLDLEVLSKVKGSKVDLGSEVNVRRWRGHLESFGESERRSFAQVEVAKGQIVSRGQNYDALVRMS